MIRIEKEKLPKEYERVILEEYYNFFQKFNGSSLFQTKPNFTTNVEKQKISSLHDESFQEAIEAYNSISQNDIEFMLYLPKDVVTALARIKLDETSLHIAEIIYLDYPGKNEIVKTTLKIIAECLEYGKQLNLEKLYFEIPKFDNIALMVALNNGFSYYEESIAARKENQTFLLEKNIIRKYENEWTRSRKQGKE